MSFMNGSSYVRPLYDIIICSCDISDKGLRVKTISKIEESDQLTTNVNEDLLIIFYSNNFQDNFWYKISKRMLKKTLIIVKKEHTSNILNDISKTNFNLNIFFMIYTEHFYTFKEILKLQNQTRIIMKNVTVILDLDLQGLHLSTISNSFWPYLYFLPCETNNVGGKCTNQKYDGYLVDFMNTAAEMMNFTWSSDISTDWGKKPKPGPNNTVSIVDRHSGTKKIFSVKYLYSKTIFVNAKLLIL